MPVPSPSLPLSHVHPHPRKPGPYPTTRRARQDNRRPLLRLHLQHGLIWFRLLSSALSSPLPLRSPLNLAILPETYTYFIDYPNDPYPLKTLVSTEPTYSQTVTKPHILQVALVA